MPRLEGIGRPAGHVASSLKQYMGYSVPLTGETELPRGPETILREYFLPNIRCRPKGRRAHGNDNSGEINGVPGHVNITSLLTSCAANSDQRPRRI